MPFDRGPGDIAVDDVGTLYVVPIGTGGTVEDHHMVRFAPSEYPPTPSTTYGSPTVVDPSRQYGQPAVDLNTGHLFAINVSGGYVIEYGSAAEGNPVLKSSIGQGTLEAGGGGIAVDSGTGDIYVASNVIGRPSIPTPAEPFVSVVYVFGSGGDLKETISGSDTPAGGFSSSFGHLFPAVDEKSGEVFVTDFEGSGRAFRFIPNGSGGYEYSPDSELETHSYSSLASGRIAVANETGISNARNVYIASPSEPISHLFAFSPAADTGPPIISGTAFAGITTSEVTLNAEINPHGAASQYRFEYVDDASFRQDVELSGPDHGFDHALSTPEGSIPTGNSAVSVSKGLSGLNAGTTYHFRAYAFNRCKAGEPEVDCPSVGEREEEGKGTEIPHTFTTYPSLPVQGSCPNEASRLGPSATLPDCRAYELVSPANIGGSEGVTGAALGGHSNVGGFATHLASPDGESVVFETVRGSIPGTNGNGYLDRYEARRGLRGWTSESESPSGSQSELPLSGGVSADHRFSFWTAAIGASPASPDEGSLVLGGPTAYVRRPGGSFELLGQGALDIDLRAQGRWISADGGHIVFTSTKKLEEGAPAPSGGTEGVYDRTADGVLHVASLLPGNATPGAATNVSYQGVSADGSTIAFEVEEAGVSTLYLRVDGSETVAVQSGATVFAGLSADGNRLTYLKGGEIFSFDTDAHTTTQIGSGGESTVVNVSADGSHVYFVSPKALGAGATVGKDNLYVWDEATMTAGFVAVLTHLDVTGEKLKDGTELGGLALWSTAAVSPMQIQIQGPGSDPSRTSPNGRYLVFESRAGLAGHKADGHPQIYRYDSAQDDMHCVSCGQDLASSTASAHLQSLLGEEVGRGTNALSLVQNITDDGRMVFFQTSEALVAADTNGVEDVYEWEADGAGGCGREQGCLALISSGRGAGPSFIYGVAAAGRDVFFTTTDVLVSAPGAGGSIAIYDARINGGFAPSPTPPSCQLDACQAGTVARPPIAAPASAKVAGPGNVSSRQGRKGCKSRQGQVTRGHKRNCVASKPHHKKQKRQRQGGSR
jgi:Tol biopolymer transport system component